MQGAGQEWWSLVIFPLPLSSACSLSARDALWDWAEGRSAWKWETYLLPLFPAKLSTLLQLTESPGWSRAGVALGIPLSLVS